MAFTHRYPRPMLLPSLGVPCRRYLKGNNDLGFVSGISATSCAARCRLLAPTCRSFDAGRDGTSASGTCYLSSLGRNSPGAVLLGSSNFDYYEVTP